MRVVLLWRSEGKLTIMKKMYDKNKLTFALLWIAAYVILCSAADNVSEMMGISKIVTTPVLLVISVVLIFWIFREKLNKELGLCKFAGKAKDYLYFIPLVALVTVNLWNGVRFNFSALETVLYIISMICVGFLEEVIFRGFLFKAICKDGVKKAFIISSVTFGLGHIINLLNGADILPTLLQIFYAVAIGFLFTLIFYKSGSLLPCIFTHGLFNAMSAFGVESTGIEKVASCLVLCAIPAVYSLWIIRVKERITR